MAVGMLNTANGKSAMNRIRCYRRVTHQAAPVGKFLRKPMNLRRMTS